MSVIKYVNINKINNELKEETTDSVVVEKVLNLFVNNELYTSIMCTPKEVRELALGFLFSEGVVDSVNCIREVSERDEEKLCITLSYDIDGEVEFRSRKAITSGCAKGTLRLIDLMENDFINIDSDFKVKINDILRFMKDFNSKSELFKETGGVHSCCIGDGSGILLFSEDIGRHNAMDKVIGKALMNEMKLNNKFIMTTGRISSDIVIKGVKAGIPIIISHSAPTDLALSIAKNAKVTLIGFVRGKRMNIYCGKERVT